MYKTLPKQYSQPCFPRSYKRRTLIIHAKRGTTFTSSPISTLPGLSVKLGLPVAHEALSSDIMTSISCEPGGVMVSLKTIVLPCVESGMVSSCPLVLDMSLPSLRAESAAMVNRTRAAKVTVTFLMLLARLFA